MSSKVIYDGAVYAKARPHYSDTIYGLIEKFHRAHAGNMYGQEKCHEVAIDVGTGTGIVAARLAQQFKQVIGIDRLQDMLTNAIQMENIAYKLAHADALPLESGSVDLCTVATAFHWFNHEPFFQEMKRVLKPNGTLAIFGYFFPIIVGNDEARSVLEDLVNNDLNAYFDRKVDYVKNFYRDIRFPFTTTEWYISPKSEDKEQIGQDYEGSLMPQDVTLEALRGYAKSTSAYINYKKEKGQEADEKIDSAIDRIKTVMQLSSTNEIIHVEWPIALVLSSNN